jgi:hypothetical protein
MKAHFRFIGNNKMKADFGFIESAKRGGYGWLRALSSNPAFNH